MVAQGGEENSYIEPSYDDVDRSEDSSSYDPTLYHNARPMSELVKDEEHSQQQRMENGVNEEDEDAVVALPDSESEAEDDGIDA